MGKFHQCIQSYGPSFMTKFCSTIYLENLLRNIFAKLNLRGGVSCMPAALLSKKRFTIFAISAGFQLTKRSMSRSGWFWLPVFLILLMSKLETSR